MINGIPRKRDYIKWMIYPAILGTFTLGIGAIVLMIVWAVDTKNMARANYFRAIFIMAGTGMCIAVIFLVTMTLFIGNLFH